jgi:prepilin-type N-terminal cleavage/methylation domain-containing protein
MRLRERFRSERGFGLVELLIAMVMLATALLALVAALSSGVITLQRSGASGTAGTLADRQMEKYRGLKYTSILLDTTAQGTANSDTVYSGEGGVGTGSQVTGACTLTSWVDPCDPRQTVSGASSPDKRSYRIDTYIRYETPTGGRQLKLVTVVVRDTNKLTGPPLAKLQSRFDEATGR